MKFKKKPIVIEAIQWKGDNFEEIFDFIETDKYIAIQTTTPDIIIIPTLEGDMRASIGDWIIKGVNGEFYPCKPDIFNKTYDPVDNHQENLM